MGLRAEREKLEAQKPGEGSVPQRRDDFFLNSKRASGRSEKMPADYQRKLGAFQRWGAARNTIDEESLLGACDHAMFATISYAGWCIEEVTPLDVRGAVFEKDQEEVRVWHGQGNKERRVPTSARLKRPLRCHLWARKREAAAGGVPFGRRGPSPQRKGRTVDHQHRQAHPLQVREEERPQALAPSDRSASRHLSRPSAARFTQPPTAA